MNFSKHYRNLYSLLWASAKELECSIDKKALAEALDYLEDNEYGLACECLLAEIKKHNLSPPPSLVKAAKKMDILS